MKNYKEYEKRFIGASDIAALILVGCDENGLKTSTLDFLAKTEVIWHTSLTRTRR